MKLIRAFFRNVPKYLLWLVLSTLFWAWIFTFVKDTSPEKKIVLYADVFSLSDRDLSVRLEEDMPDGIKMIRAHTFDYAMFNDASLGQGDLYIVPEDSISTYLDDFIPISPSFVQDTTRKLYIVDGKVYGIQVYDAAAGEGIAEAFIQYAPEAAPAQDYYLFFGARSLHAGTQDTAAYAVAGSLLSIH